MALHLSWIIFWHPCDNGNKLTGTRSSLGKDVIVGAKHSVLQAACQFSVWSEVGAHTARGALCISLPLLCSLPSSQQN